VVGYRAETGYNRISDTTPFHFYCDNRCSLFCSKANGSQSNTAEVYYDEEQQDFDEEFQDDLRSETDEDEYCVEWKEDDCATDAVDSHHCNGLFSIEEERSPDLVR